MNLDHSAPWSWCECECPWCEVAVAGGSKPCPLSNPAVVGVMIGRPPAVEPVRKCLIAPNGGILGRIFVGPGPPES